MPADEHSRWPDQPGGVAMRPARGPYGQQMRQQHQRLVAELTGRPARPSGGRVAQAIAAMGDANDHTHTRVYADTVKPYDRAHAVVHAVVRLAVAPPFTGMRSVYLTACGRAMPVGESVRCARPVTCTKPQCATADTRKPGARACNPEAGRS